jgi:hypothetical protein
MAGAEFFTPTFLINLISKPDNFIGGRFPLWRILVQPECLLHFHFVTVILNTVLGKTRKSEVKWRLLV